MKGKKLILVLAQKRRHIMRTWRRKQRRVSPAERNRAGKGAVEKDMLLIL